MLFYFHGGDLDLSSILNLFLIGIVIVIVALAIIGAFVLVLYSALHKQKNKALELTIFNDKKDENSLAPQD